MTETAAPPGLHVAPVLLRLPGVVLVLPAVTVLMLSVCFWQDIRGTDDVGYAQAAMSVLSRDQSPSLARRPTHHDARLGMVYPLAAVFMLFGVGGIALAALPLLCTVLTASLVAWLGSHWWDARVGLAAGLLYALVPVTVDLSSFYVPEPILTLQLCLAVVLFLMAEKAQGWRSMALGLGAGALVGTAYLTTEVGALMLPVLYLYLLFGSGLRIRHAWPLAGALLVLCLELTYHLVVDGSALHRFSHGARYLDAPLVRAANANLSYRLLKAYPSTLVYPSTDFGLLGPLLAIGGLYGLSRVRRHALPVLWAAAVLLFYNFMSVSLSRYVALPVSARLIAPACVPLALMAGKLLVDVGEWVSRRSAAASRRVGWALYATGAMGAVAASLLAMYLNTTLTLTSAAARNAESAAWFLRKEPAVTLVSDPRSARLIHFYRQFNPRDAFMRFETAGKRQDAGGADDGRPAFVVLNGPIVYERELTGARYGGSLSLSPADLDALALFRTGPEGEIFTARPPRRHRLEYLHRSAAVRHLLPAGSYGFVEEAMVARPPLGDVRVFRYPAMASSR